MESDFKTTTRHTIIRAWVENQGGRPALIVDPNRLDRQVGLRINFPGKNDEALLSHAHKNKDVSWEEFFTVFEKQGLAFSYLEDPANTDLVDAYMFLKREAVKEDDTKDVLDPEAFAKAIRDDGPALFIHDGLADDPHQGEIEFIKPDDVIGEESIGGSTPAPESDDDITQTAKDLGIK